MEPIKSSQSEEGKKQKATNLATTNSTIINVTVAEGRIWMHNGATTTESLEKTSIPAS